MSHPLPDAQLLMLGLVEQSLAGIYLIREGQFSYVNPEFARIFGYDAPEEIIDRVDMVALIAPEDRAKVVENVRLRAAGLVTEMRYTFTGLRRDGARIQVEVHGRSIEVDGAAAVIGLILDVTARQQAERAKSAFLSVVGHELRTPLHHIKSFGHLLAADVQSERGRGRLAKLTQAAERLQTLIEAVLDHARLERGAVQASGADFAVAELIGQAGSAVAAAAAEKSLSLVSRIAADCPPWLHGDAARIGQALGCLVGNAVKFSDRGQVTLRADARPGEGAGLRLRIEVEDQGPGIAADIQAGIFDLFNQGDNSHTRRFGGVGLGLALCRQLVAVLDGGMGFSSRESQGSTFWIEVPVGLPHAQVV